MRMLRFFTVASAFFIIVGAAVLVSSTRPLAYQQHAAGAHQHPEAAKLKNPVTADETSIAAGKKLYTEHCSECHGEAGKGDGPAAEFNDPKPPDLTDADWKHGSSEGEIFTVIRDGVEDTGMKGFAKKIPERQIWDVVNYVRSLGPKPAKGH
jgi:mono/diheme cytochrome c family protein